MLRVTYIENFYKGVAMNNNIIVFHPSYESRVQEIIFNYLIK